VLDVADTAVRGEEKLELLMLFEELLLLVGMAAVREEVLLLEEELGLDDRPALIADKFVWSRQDDDEERPVELVDMVTLEGQNGPKNTLRSVYCSSLWMMRRSLLQ